MAGAGRPLADYHRAMNTTITPAALVESTDLLGDPAALRARGEADGYLFFRGRLPEEPLLALRREILHIIEDHGLLAGGADPEAGPPDDAVADLGALADTPLVGGCTDPIYRDVQRLESFHRLAHHPDLLAIYEALFDGPVVPHPRNIARVLLPGPQARATPPHQDFIHVQGATQTWTAWFPLGDCPRDLGGLSVLRASHRKGVLAVGPAEGAGGLVTQLCRGEDDWLEIDYAAGDVLTFPSTTVHKGLPNQRPDRIRLSCDFRYQSADEPIEEKSLLPHREVLTWEEVYAGWGEGADDLKYYWRDREMALSPWDESIRWQKERICD